MSLTYDGIIHRSLEEQVRYDAEQVQLLKQADVTINENLQTVNTEINGKLTKPTNPSAESAVTMLADGTVGTKPLSEIVGKLYMHRVAFTFDNGSYLLIINIPTNTKNNINVDFLKNYIHGYCVVAYNGNLGNGAVNLYYTPNNILISGSAVSNNNNNIVHITYSNSDGLVINSQLLIEL